MTAAPRPETPATPAPLSLKDYEAGVLAGDRTVLARAITLCESRAPEHQTLASQLLARLLPATGRAHRVGVTGVPGVGKSTLIETLGGRLAAAGRRLAVLAVDPSSVVSGGSILGDKTRMVRLANDPLAFVRPSPSSGTLGGVAHNTREAMLLCEAAGFDVVLVETVGVGQSEAAVAEMVDFFLVLMLAGAGDELQGIKRGLLELADMIAITKADGENVARAETARQAFERALGLMRPTFTEWRPPVIAVSALRDEGLDELWRLVQEHRRRLEAAGHWAARRRAQQVRWMWSMVEDRLETAFRAHPRVRTLLPELEAAVREGRLPATAAAEQLLAAFGLSGLEPP